MIENCHSYVIIFLITISHFISIKINIFAYIVDSNKNGGQFRNHDYVLPITIYYEGYL